MQRLLWPSALQIGQRHRLSNDAGQWQSQSGQRLAGTKARTQHLRTGCKRRMRSHTIRADHEQRAVTPEDVHAAIGQHGDMAIGIRSELALP
jgi:hypothetical protein